MIREHENEPVLGLPERLPEGETVLWQGRPNWRGVARHIFLTRWAIGWFALIALWRGVDTLEQGGGALDAVLAATSIAPVAAAGLGLLALLAWATASTTIYTITNRRVAMRIGVALPLIVNAPFAKIATARLKPVSGGRDGETLGDIALEISGRDRFAYLVLWPHARPWRLGSPQPSMRAVPNAPAVAALLAEAMLAENPEGVVGVAAEGAGGEVRTPPVAANGPMTTGPVGLAEAVQ